MIPSTTARSAILGAPLDVNKQPSGSGVVRAIEQLDARVIANSAGAIIKNSLANLNAAVSPAAGAMAWVIGDATVANNGVYENTGTSDTPTWVRRGDLPYGYIHAINVGAGTANAIQVTTAIPVPSADGAAEILVPIVTDNTSGTVTLSINGETALPVLTQSGNPPAIGGVTGFMKVIKLSSTYRMLSDQSSAAIQAASEAAQGYAEEWANKAEDSPVSVPAGGDGATEFSALHWATKAAAYAAVALNNWNVQRFAGDGAEVDFTLTVAPGSENNTFVVVNGVPQLKSAYSVSGTTLTFSEAPSGDGVTENIEVAYGSAISVGTPSDGSVSLLKLSSGVYASQVEAEGGTENTKLMTALRTQQAIEANLTAPAIVQTVSSTPYASYVGTTEVIPADDTIPQISEGVNILSASITPTKATNKIRVTAVLNGTTPSGSAASIVAALFDGSTNAIASAIVWGDAGAPRQVTLTHEFIAGGTSAIALTVRIGRSSAGTLYLNGSSSGRLLGGNQAMTMVVEEIEV